MTKKMIKIKAVTIRRFLSSDKCPTIFISFSLFFLDTVSFTSIFIFHYDTKINIQKLCRLSRHARLLDNVVMVYSIYYAYSLKKDVRKYPLTSLSLFFMIT